jgi:toxin ParE1/3/4
VKNLLVLTTPRAQDDIDEHAFYIAGDKLDAGLRFLDAIDHARNELARLPKIGSARRFDSPALSSLRVWPVPRFANWLIFYRIDEQTLTIVRVLHGASDLPAALDE